MSLSFLIACMYVCVRVCMCLCLWAREGGGKGGVINDWLALFVITWGVYLRRCIFRANCVSAYFLQFMWMRYCYFCVRRDWDVDCAKVYLLPLLTPAAAAAATKESFMKPNDSCLSSTWHRLTLSLQEYTHTPFLSHAHKHTHYQ